MDENKTLVMDDIIEVLFGIFIFKKGLLVSWIIVGKKVTRTARNTFSLLGTGAYFVHRNQVYSAFFLFFFSKHFSISLLPTTLYSLFPPFLYNYKSLARTHTTSNIVQHTYLAISQTFYTLTPIDGNFLH